MAERDAEAVVRRFVEEVRNGRRLDVADELLTPDHKYHGPCSVWPGSGPAGLRRRTGLFLDAFPDARWAVDAMGRDGDVVEVRWTLRATHRGEFVGVAPTGRRVEIRGMGRYRVAGGRIAASWSYWDTLGLLHQIGLLPRPAGGYTLHRLDRPTPAAARRRGGPSGRPAGVAAGRRGGAR